MHLSMQNVIDPVQGKRFQICGRTERIRKMTVFQSKIDCVSETMKERAKVPIEH